MADPTITDAVKQAVITRLATINSATSILSLLNGRPAKVTVDEVLNLAERIERWAWRDLLSENTDARAPEKPADPGIADTARESLTRTAAAESRSTAGGATAERPRAAPWRSEREADQRNLRDRKIQGAQQRRN